jgi:clathrin heavy chain
MLYFSTLLDSGAILNDAESVALCQPVLQAGKTQLVEQWISQNKLTMSDQLGDLIRQYNP